MPTQNGGTNSRSGGMSVSLAVPNGHVLGGLAGLLVAAGPVQVKPLPWNNKFVGIYYHCLIPGFSVQQVVVGSFLPGHQQEQERKTSNRELKLLL